MYVRASYAQMRAHNYAAHEKARWYSAGRRRLCCYVKSSDTERCDSAAKGAKKYNMREL